MSQSTLWAQKSVNYDIFDSGEEELLKDGLLSSEIFIKVFLKFLVAQSVTLLVLREIRAVDLVAVIR